MHQNYSLINKKSDTGMESECQNIISDQNVGLTWLS